MKSLVYIFEKKNSESFEENADRFSKILNTDWLIGVIHKLRYVTAGRGTQCFYCVPCILEGICMVLHYEGREVKNRIHPRICKKLFPAITWVKTIKLNNSLKENPIKKFNELYCTLES